MTQSAPRKGSGTMSRLSSPEAATIATERRNGSPKPRPMPITPATSRCLRPSDAGKCTASRLPREDLERGEEVGNLEGGRLGRVGAVHRVGLDGRREVFANRPRVGLGRIGGTHQLAQPRDGVVALEDDRHARTLGHERAEAAVERALLVHDVEAARLRGGELDQLGREHSEARLLEPGDDLPRDALGDGVRLDDGEGALDGHRGESLPFLAHHAGDGGAHVGGALDGGDAGGFHRGHLLGRGALAPGDDGAGVAHAAPGGAVWPQMNPTTGLVTWALTKAAASSSAVPPISPIIMIEVVSGSAWKSRSTSMKLVPVTGSPPMPTHDDCPSPRWVS